MKFIVIQVNGSINWDYSTFSFHRYKQFFKPHNRAARSCCGVWILLWLLKLQSKSLRPTLCFNKILMLLNLTVTTTNILLINVNSQFTIFFIIICQLNIIYWLEEARSFLLLFQIYFFHFEILSRLFILICENRKILINENMHLDVIYFILNPWLTCGVRYITKLWFKILTKNLFKQ